MSRVAAGWVVGSAWLAAVAGGFGAWHRYETAVGSTGPRAAERDRPAGGRWRLVVFVHPHCPCSGATLGEVAEVVRSAPELFVQIVFVRPPGAPDGWERTDLWAAAGRVPGVEVSCDAGGGEAARFGAATSGHTVLIDPSGRPVFRGGLTRARGREGISPGRRAVLDWVNNRDGVDELPIFGCTLGTPDE